MYRITYAYESIDDNGMPTSGIRTCTKEDPSFYEDAFGGKTFAGAEYIKTISIEHLKQFKPREGATYRVTGAHYEDRFNVLSTYEDECFSTDEPFDYNLAKFRKWLKRKNLTVKEVAPQ